MAVTQFNFIVTNVSVDTIKKIIKSVERKRRNCLYSQVYIKQIHKHTHA